MSIIARLTGYTPENTAEEGGPADRLGRPLQTLQGWLNNTHNVFTRGTGGEVTGLTPRFGRAPYVSVAGERHLANHIRFHMPDFDIWAAARGFNCPPIVFEICDCGDEAYFPLGSGLAHLDICTENQHWANDPFLNKRHTIILLSEPSK